jgi:hypothetical protein
MSASIGRRGGAGATATAGTLRSGPLPRGQRRAGRASRSQTPRGVAQRLGHLAAELGEGHRHRPGSRDEAEPQPRPWQEGRLTAVGLPEPPARPVPPYASPQLPAGREGCRPPTRSGAPQEHEARALDAAPPAEQPLKLPPIAQPLPAGQGRPGHAGRGHTQTESRRRPLARRRLRTFRPPLVDIRSRKPCVFFRRRRFG